MRRQISELTSKIWTRVRRDGLYVASRYYVGASIHAAHYLLYDRRWDRLDACRTSGAVTPQKSDVVGETGSLEKARYQAMARLPLIWALEALELDTSEFGFVDYGSGRGRLMLTAARFPFREVIGVEFSGPLHQEACANIRSYPRELLACIDIASVHINALEFNLPDGDWVAFFFNPFTEDVLQRVAQRVVESRRGSSRRAYVIFGNSDRMAVLRNFPGLKRIRPRGLPALLLKTLAPVPFEFYLVGSVETQSRSRAPSQVSKARPIERIPRQAEAKT
jgi:hypothetical protein